MTIFLINHISLFKLKGPKAKMLEFGFFIVFESKASDF